MPPPLNTAGRFVAVVAAAKKLSHSTIEEWRVRCHLPANIRCTLHRALTGGTCLDARVRQRLIAVAAAFLQMPMDDVLGYIETGEMTLHGRLNAILRSRIWYPNPRRVGAMLEQVWAVERNATESITLCSVLPPEWMTAPVAKAYHRFTAIRSTSSRSDPAGTLSIIRALDRYARQRRIALGDPDRPKRTIVLMSLTGLLRMMNLQSPFQLCRVRDVDDCIETLRFCHMERSDFTLHLLDDRKEPTCVPWAGLFDSLCDIDGRFALRRLHSYPALLLTAASTSPGAASLITAQREVLQRLAKGALPTRLSVDATKQFLETCLSPGSWYRRRHGA